MEGERVTMKRRLRKARAIKTLCDETRRAEDGAVGEDGLQYTELSPAAFLARIAATGVIGEIVVPPELRMKCAIKAAPYFARKLKR